ncbi:phosphonate metabolism transcriptional regulator PhnF [Verminephrobacter aporrectodeae]|uniref:phosphonate metabolism transcriptional regulator PhnF n=1 Tax=Verminephrobacter aporrectodeae TaxID=1110389 RepID=UPI002238370C|nr:phosphonate metabolism transcriptional regulator PhnF [Verminephrobacter aporrectodeae]MCW5221792.1 phosphonate metabolism transcriptional regulator PhnF [Verminephrobacter aporrectodeae subsp. tuberculatae]MCW5291083.1 phosphonate metabolism transcriptional regulator PhnF [Verminephrobacter aporrectodeae subsp. tuberculatae]MCW8163704.1 phosphonate metabolism transcriptional regulator PhnF [Verminephrobacter aporrectodeae subsp. tuberculatae]MCW8168426.1 phosphonate metabolism transcription
MTASIATLSPVSPPCARRPARASFWTRITAELTDAIGRGVYPPGQRLPSEHALAEQFGVNRHTIRRCLANLCSQGLVRITQGSGTYVEDFAVDLALGKRMRHQQGLAQSGLRGSLVLLHAQTVRASAALARALQVPARSPLLALRVMGEAEGRPLHLSERWFPLPRFEGLAAVVRETGSITAGFRAHGVSDYTRRESRITAELPDAALAAGLRQPATRPVLLVESLNVDLEGRPIEWARAWFAGDRVKLNIQHGEHDERTA